MIRLIILLILFVIQANAYDYTDLIRLNLRSGVTQVLARINNLQGQQVEVYLPYTKLVHDSGKIVYANERGEVALEHPANEYQVSLSSKYFSMQLADEEPMARLNQEEIIYMNDFFAIENLTVRANLDIARKFALENMVEGANTSWFYRPLHVILDFDDGCNAAWNGKEILIFTGDSTCIKPALSADMIIHEYGHGVLSNISQWQKYPADFEEAFADIFMAMLTRDAAMSEGLYPNRGITYIRDLNQDYFWPGDWRGVYTGSLVFSSTVWDAIAMTKEEIGDEAYLLGAKILFRIPVYGDFRQSDIDKVSQSFYNLMMQMPEVYTQKRLYCNIPTLFRSRGINNIAELCGAEQATPTAKRNPRLTLKVNGGDIPNASRLEQRFVVNLTNIQVVDIQLDIDHFFTDDLMIYFEFPDGSRSPIYKGLEEILIPKSIKVQNFPKNYHGAVTLVIEDQKKDFSGSLHSGKILFY